MTTILPGACQIPGRLLGLCRNRHLHNLTQMQQPGQVPGVPSIFSELEK